MNPQSLHTGWLPAEVSQASLLEEIYNKLPDMVFLFDVKERKFIMRNPALNHMLGFEHLKDQEINCISLRTLIHPEDWRGVQAAVTNVGTGEQAVVEVECRCMDKMQQYQFFHTRLSVFEKQGEDILYILGIAQNITERKKFRERRLFS